MRGRRSRPTIERLLERICIDDDGCWLWQGSLNRGYGQISHEVTNGHPQTVEKTHRVAYRHFVGPIPHGLELDHLCRNLACCNPDHLEPVTARENVARSIQARFPGNTATPPQVS